jgi:hypothetical protein
MARMIDADKLIANLRDAMSYAHPSQAATLAYVCVAIDQSTVDEAPKPAARKKTDARS